MPKRANLSQGRNSWLSGDREQYEADEKPAASSLTGHKAMTPTGVKPVASVLTGHKTMTPADMKKKAKPVPPKNFSDVPISLPLTTTKKA